MRYQEVNSKYWDKAVKEILRIMEVEPLTSEK